METISCSNIIYPALHSKEAYAAAAPSYTQRAPTPAVHQPLYSAPVRHPQTPPSIAREKNDGLWPKKRNADARTVFNPHLWHTALTTFNELCLT